MNYFEIEKYLSFFEYWYIDDAMFFISRYPVRRYYGKRNGMFYGNKYNPTMYDEDTEWR